MSTCMSGVKGRLDLKAMPPSFRNLAVILIDFINCVIFSVCSLAYSFAVCSS
jgi:hypothetical protein